MVSILMLTYNAPRYIIKTLLSLKKTESVNYELFVVDNHSRFFTRVLLSIFKELLGIDYLYLNSYNSLFAKGNNLASTFASSESDYYLLLNSDIMIKDKMWLKHLLDIHPRNGGISSYGAVLTEPKRADGYCFLINRFLYDRFKLDEQYEWWWSITKLESQVLAEKYEIIAVVNHEKMLHHYGGASGQAFNGAKGMDTSFDTVNGWFKNCRQIQFIEEIK